MNIICLDFETRFDDAYTLKKLTTEHYVRDARFEALGCAIRDQQRRWLDFEEIQPHTVWVPHDKLSEIFATYDWSQTAIVAHHAQFDGLILSHHYGVKPAAWFCTLSMARLLLGNHLSVGLDSLAKHFNLSAKTVPYNLFKGRSWCDLTSDVQRQVAAGATQDVALTWQIFGILRESFPAEEYQVVATTIRMFTESCLRGDINLLADLWEEENRVKKLRLSQLGVSANDLASADKFAALLGAEGIEAQTKKGKNGPIYAFAKTDQFMRDLLEHDNERVRTLAEARLGEKSTLLQTRAETLGWMARRGPMPVYLRYAGAHTTRWSGGDGANWQNFKRGSAIRKAILAPEGCQLLVADLSQIECVAGGQRVLTNHGLKPIELVSVDDFVFDGIDWVKHGGVIYKGERNVITVDGFTATSDHVVYPKQFPQGITLGAFNATRYSFTASRWQNAIRQATLQQQSLSRLQNLWSAWRSVLFCKREGRCTLDNNQFTSRNLQKYRNRSNQQRWSLCAWKFTVIYTAGKCKQSVYNFLGATSKWRAFGYAGFQTSTSRMWIWPRPDQRFSGNRFAWRTDCGTLPNSVLENDLAQTKKAKVYDLLNCGPRHRFVCEGIIVSNCRILCHLAGQHDYIEKFAKGVDPYLGMASKAYGYPVTKEMQKERGVGKQLVLSAGYQSGAKTIQNTARLGIYGPPVTIDLATAETWKQAYRKEFWSVVRYWGEADTQIPVLANGGSRAWGPMAIFEKKIYGPGGTMLHYDTLARHVDEETGESLWRYRTRYGWTKLYSGKLVENVVQWLARIVLSQAMLRLHKLGYKMVTCSHDEVVIVLANDGKQEYHVKQVEQVLSRTPDWLPGLPLACECVLGDRYSK